MSSHQKQVFWGETKQRNDAEPKGTLACFPLKLLVPLSALMELLLFLLVQQGTLAKSPLFATGVP